MIDITTRYLGLDLKSPLVASASPLCESVDNIRGSKMRALRRSFYHRFSKNSSRSRVKPSIRIFGEEPKASRKP